MLKRRRLGEPTTGLPRRGKPQTGENAERADAREGIESADGHPTGRVVAEARSLDGCRSTVVTDRREEELDGGVAVVGPGGEVGAGERLEERLHLGAVAVIEQHRDLADVPRERERAGASLVLEVLVELPDVMERGEHAQPRDLDVIEVVEPAEPRESSAQQRPREQRLSARRDVGAVIRERVPRDDLVVTRRELPPKPHWFSPHAADPRRTASSRATSRWT